MRLGCDKLLENGFIGNGDVRKWMEAGFLLNVRRKSNQEPREADQGGSVRDPDSQK